MACLGKIEAGDPGAHGLKTWGLGQRLDLETLLGELLLLSLRAARQFKDGDSSLLS